MKRLIAGLIALLVLLTGVTAAFAADAPACTPGTASGAVPGVLFAERAAGAAAFLPERPAENFARACAAISAAVWRSLLLSGSPGKAPSP